MRLVLLALGFIFLNGLVWEEGVSDDVEKFWVGL